jgi:hypothetical protein
VQKTFSKIFRASKDMSEFIGFARPKNTIKTNPFGSSNFPIKTGTFFFAVFIAFFGLYRKVSVFTGKPRKTISLCFSCIFWSFPKTIHEKNLWIENSLFLLEKQDKKSFGFFPVLLVARRLSQI